MPGICRVSSTKGIHYSIFDCTSKLAVGPGTLGRKKDLPWQALYIVIRYDLRSTAEYAVVREHAATPINLLLVEFGLRRDGERDEPRSLIGSPEPTVGHDRLVVSPLAGKFEMLGNAEDVGVFVSPDPPIAGDSEVLAGGEEYEVGDGFEDTDAILDLGTILKDFYPTPVDDGVRELMNFESGCRSHHLRKLQPFTTRSHCRIHGGERHVLELFLAIGVLAESLVAVQDLDLIGRHSDGHVVSP